MCANLIKKRFANNLADTLKIFICKYLEGCAQPRHRALVRGCGGGGGRETEEGGREKGGGRRRKGKGERGQGEGV